jgi:hypothetical protein
MDKCYKEISSHDLMETSFEHYNERFKIKKGLINRRIESIVNRIGKLKRNKIVIISGYPGSGKSTITSLLKDIGYKVLSMDDGIRSYRELSDITFNEVEHSTKHIVLDGTFMKQKEINNFLWINDLPHYDLLHVYMNIPIHYAYFNNVNRCLDKRNKRKLLPYKVYKLMESKNDVILPKKGLYLLNYDL